ncbi:MAG: AbrB/MazE/SpoVT family DNA-binding domain-containing protein [Anaerolineaceae bacterium]|jgi:AbrB family looped-hinge helix DNA binding protein
METLVSKRGQTVVPAPIRKRYHIHEGDRLVWVDDGKSIKVIPVPAKALEALRGRGKDEALLEKLLTDRKEARSRER